MIAPPRASREQVLAALGKRDWATAAELATALSVPEHRTIDVVRTLNDLRAEQLVFRSTAADSDSPLAYWAVAA